MRKMTLVLSAAGLSLLNSGARAESQDLGTWASTIAAPQPATVAVLALIGMGFLVLLASTPLGTASAKTPPHRFKWPSLSGAWPSQRATLALFAMIAVGGSLGMA
ncbi:hypothetical protein [Pseudorhodobacter ferrugineus]|uniref:hypothetical protein n=1 Tax=Pseudorhodobacter ferrugineus TaxID=77008 RepID=UPI0003FF7C1E|nr:hypothetical protein [Pseudorhodobacter ferrugineus]